MISIRRMECPTFLASSRSKAAYRDETVVTELWRMQNGKCCYCEAKIPDEGHGKAVEHWQPKAVFKGRTNDWHNLLLACPHCNGAKADQFPTVIMGSTDTPKVVYLKNPDGGKPAILDPCDESVDPEDLIGFVMEIDSEDIGLAFPKTQAHADLSGNVTIDVVGLHRDFYRKEHAKFIRQMMKEFLLMSGAKEDGDESSVGQCLREFRRWVSAKHQYTAIARAFARRYKIDQIFNLEIPKGCA